MQVAAFQCPVSMDVSINLRALADALATFPPQTLVVTPEGLLSGYKPEKGFVAELNEAATADAIERARTLAMKHEVHLLAGACVRIEGTWRNATYYLGPEGQSWRYDKVNLAWSERADFEAGARLPVFDLSIAGQPVRLGVQMCREIRYPEQWRALAAQGAQIIAYVNNAVGSRDGYDVWRSHVISRAAETQRFVIGANNAAGDQLCTSLIVAPNGRVMAEASIGDTIAAIATIELSEVSDWVLSQARADVVTVALQKS